MWKGEKADKVAIAWHVFKACFHQKKQVIMVKAFFFPQQGTA